MYAKTPKRKPVLSQLRLGQLPTSDGAWKSVSSTFSLSGSGSESWRLELEKYSSKLLTPARRPPEIVRVFDVYLLSLAFLNVFQNAVPLKLLWACSHGLVELAYQLIMREGTSRTTKTKVGWSPLNEILRFLLTIPTPFATEKASAAAEMHKLMELARMVASDSRIDVSLAASDEVKAFQFECEWDDSTIAYSPFSLCLQGYAHYNPDMLALLQSRGARPDGIAFLAMIKSRYFKLYREWVPRYVKCEFSAPPYSPFLLECTSPF